MPLDFPNSPTPGQTYSAMGTTWTWDGVKWNASGVVPLTDNDTLVISNGSSVPRSLATRFAERANVLDFGAVADTGFDSTNAFRAAAATGKPVFIPAGLYRVTDLMVLGLHGEIYGDGRGLSRVLVYPTFNMSALGVFQLQSGGEPAGSMHDFSIEFQHTGATSRATLFPFPPAIYAQNAARFRIYNMMITNAMTGLDARGNCGGSYIDRFEVGAFNYGMRWDGSADAVHIDNYHFWPFAIGSLTSVFGDGNTVAADFGKIDYCCITNFVSLYGKVLFSNPGGAATPGWYEITNMGMDFEFSTVQVDSCNWLHINNFYSTKSGSAANPPSLKVNGGRVRVTSYEITQGTVVAPIQVTGGELHLFSGSVRKGSNKNGVATVSGGLLHIDGMVCTDGGSGALGNALFTQTGTGILQVANSSYTGSCSSGNAFSFASTDPLHSVSNFNTGPALSLNVPATLVTTIPGMAVLDPLPANAVNDTAAASAGVIPKGIYRNGSALMVRVV